MTEFFRALFLIFIAEMGDKTQILAMAFATKYKIKQVVLGILLGSFLNHALAVILGANLYHIVPIKTLTIIAGFSFLLFGIWNLKMDDEEEENIESKRGPILTVALAFFIGELGDKTQLTAIVLSTDAINPFFILLGTVSGMVLTGLLGILVGIKLGNKIDEFYIKVGASTVFYLFGFIKLWDTKILDTTTLIILILFVLVASYYLLLPTVKQRRLGTSTTYQRTATRLHNYYNDMYLHLEDICLGENHCGVCGGTNCLIGHTKAIVLQAKLGQEVDIKPLQDILKKDFKREKVLEALKETILLLEEDFDSINTTIIHQIRNNLEHIMYKQPIIATTYQEYLTKLQTIDSNLYQIIKKQTKS